MTSSHGIVLTISRFHPKPYPRIRTVFFFSRTGEKSFVFGTADWRTRVENSPIDRERTAVVARIFLAYCQFVSSISYINRSVK